MSDAQSTDTAAGYAAAPDEPRKPKPGIPDAARVKRRKPRRRRKRAKRKTKDKGKAVTDVASSQELTKQLTSTDAAGRRRTQRKGNKVHLHTSVGAVAETYTLDSPLCPHDGLHSAEHRAPSPRRRFHATERRRQTESLAPSEVSVEGRWLVSAAASAACRL